MITDKKKKESNAKVRIKDDKLRRGVKEVEYGSGLIKNKEIRNWV